MRDKNKSKLYAAEEFVFGETSLEEQVGMEMLTLLANRLLDTPWWQHNSIPFTLEPTRREANRSYARYDEKLIRISIGLETPTSLVHETAHLLAAHYGERESHGQIFRAAYVDTTAVLVGSQTSERLRQVFEGNGLPVGARQWNAPDAVSQHGLYGELKVDEYRRSISHIEATPRLRTDSGAIPLGVAQN